MAEAKRPDTGKPPCRRVDALEVLKRLRDAGHVAYFAGGCVRDELMGIEPKDFDVATDAPPQRVRELFGFTQAVGQAFGVILVHFGQSVVEVATFRSDGAYLDGRRPSQVQFSNAEHDAKRRDFTINGIFLDPLTNQTLDYVGGLDDLASKTLRAIGDPSARFAEDHLRLLRAVRFAARFGLNIDPATQEAIKAHAQHLKAISPERIADELRMTLEPATRMIAWPLLNDFGLLDVVFRFAGPATTTQSDPQWAIFLNLGEDRAPIGLALAAAAVSRQKDIRAAFGAAEVRSVTHAMRQSLRISNDESDDLSLTLLGIDMLLTDPPPRLATIKRFLARRTAPLSRRLMQAVSTAGFLHDRIDELEKRLTQVSQVDYAPEPLVTGDDLTAAGLTPGKLFKHVLDAVYDEQLENRLSSKEQAMELALRLAEELK